MEFKDWFDPYNSEHVEAYIHMHKTSTWPENFANEINQRD